MFVFMRNELYDQWANKTKTRGTLIAERTGYSATAANKWIAGEARISQFASLYIEALSRGAVPAESWLSSEHREKLKQIRIENGIF
jgi:hypothetical protein